LPRWRCLNKETAGSTLGGIFAKEFYAKQQQRQQERQQEAAAAQAKALDTEAVATGELQRQEL
jgi:hypothetical protein